MAKNEFNRSAELEVFLKVVEFGSFSAAACFFDNTPSSVSKTITKLEKRLGARLFNRSTRQLSLTGEGCIFYEKGLDIIASFNEAERLVSQQTQPSGKIRINCNIPFGKKYILPLIPDFLSAYPEISIHLELTDKVINVLEESADVAIRSGKLSDSNLISKKLGDARMVVASTPEYLKLNGYPQVPDELKTHNLLDFTFSRNSREWPFIVNGKEKMIAPQGNIKVSDGESLRYLLLSGLGIARLAYFQVEEDLKEGRLVSVLEDFTPTTTESIYAVFVGQGGMLPNRIRAFVDFLFKHLKVE
ncbi:MAG: LysR family transcriptional regulator [Pseudoalteromonas prydzensis]|uniref:LysR family transcriptional regulator n=1 Tax=Pseudoalteromonas prydzensis TaxID=182141 RepID=UPI003F9458A7